MTRCWCGDPQDAHEHFRRGKDCGRCGRALCARFAPRDKPMPESHRLVASMSDSHAMHNLAALLAFGVDTSSPAPVLPIPEQRAPDDPPSRPTLSLTAAYREALMGPRTRRKR